MPKKFFCENCGKVKFDKDNRLRRFCSHKCYSKTLIGKPPSNKGKKMPELSIKMMGNSNSPKGENHHSWKGGITPINEKIRRSKKYQLWRKAVFERDGYTCIWCHRKGVYLHSDHIKPFAYFPNLRFLIDNGRTLCRECHRKTDTYGRRALKYETYAKTNNYQ